MKKLTFMEYTEESLKNNCILNHSRQRENNKTKLNKNLKLNLQKNKLRSKRNKATV